MKKIMNRINFAIIGLMVSVPAFAAVQANSGLCALIKRLQDVFKILRTMAFIGAAFYIAGWAWKYISSGDAKPDDLKKQGIGLLVGFSMLFMIGVILSAVMSTTGQNILCGKELTTGW